MFRIKICGITGPDDALMAARAGADAIGLNFYPRSPRFVTPQQARQIVDVLPPGIVKVGLFVDAPADEIVEVHDRLGLDLIQLHGIEPPEFLLKLGGRPVMRALRLGPVGLAPIDEYLGECRVLACARNSSCSTPSCRALRAEQGKRPTGPPPGSTATPRIARRWCWPAA